PGLEPRTQCGRDTPWFRRSPAWSDSSTFPPASASLLYSAVPANPPQRQKEERQELASGSCVLRSFRRLGDVFRVEGLLLAQRLPVYLAHEILDDIFQLPVAFNHRSHALEPSRVFNLFQQNN